MTEPTFEREMISPPFERPWMRVSCSTLDCRAFEDVSGELDADRFEREHALTHPTCLLCGEFQDEADKAYGLLVCSPCRADQPDEATAAIKAYAHTAPASEVTAYFQRTVELANARAAQDGAA